MRGGKFLDCAHHESHESSAYNTIPAELRYAALTRRGATLLPGFCSDARQPYRLAAPWTRGWNYAGRIPRLVAGSWLRTQGLASIGGTSR